MPSMVLVGNLGSRWGPPGAFGGPQTGSNTCAEHERKRAIKRKRPFTLPRHLEALPRLRQGFPPLRAHVEGSCGWHGSPGDPPPGGSQGPHICMGGASPNRIALHIYALHMHYIMHYVI